jgi:phosphomannomutase / phosphoglucomutase
LVEQKKTIGELLADVPKTVATPEIRVDLDDSKKFAVVSRVLAHFKETHEVISIDGARINFKNGWGLVRASNTQPALVLRFEATDETELSIIQETVTEVLNAAIR